MRWNSKRLQSNIHSTGIELTSTGKNSVCPTGASGIHIPGKEYMTGTGTESYYVGSVRICIRNKSTVGRPVRSVNVGMVLNCSSLGFEPWVLIE
jgi:hypothetical protein